VQLDIRKGGFGHVHDSARSAKQFEPHTSENIRQQHDIFRPVSASLLQVAIIKIDTARHFSNLYKLYINFKFS